MKTRRKSRIKNNGIKALVLLFLAVLFKPVIAQGIPVLSIVLINKTLTVYSFPIQNGMANANFNFDLKNYINLIEPEVNYVITNNARRVHQVYMVDPPSGLTRIYSGPMVCPAIFSLNPMQSCVLSFSLDKTTYWPKAGPIACLSPGNLSCSQSSPDSQFNYAVLRAPGRTQVSVFSSDPNGLAYDIASMSLIGKPERPGAYSYFIQAYNEYGVTAARELQIQVSINPRDKPVFKNNYPIPTAMPNSEYRLNLMDLIEPNAGFMMNNQVHFRIDPNHRYPTWLSVDKNNPTILQGQVSPDDAGLSKAVTIIASSNSGGDTLPLTLQIPVAADPAKKPFIENGIELTGGAGEVFYNDFRPHIIDPAADGSLELVLEKIEPEAFWLNISPSNPTTLTGTVPTTAVGQNYQITLHAKTLTGGKSDSITIPLKILRDESKTPRFYAANPQLGVLYPGQPYLHDFVADNDITPEYSDIPYVVELAKDYPNPDWLYIEDNKLIADLVQDTGEQMVPVFIRITNIPGGSSEVLTLKLFVMN